MSKVILEGYIEVSDEDLAVIKEELPNHIRLTRKEAGCLVFSVKEDESSRNRFNVYEEFVNKQAYEFHQARVKKSQWGLVAKNIKRNYNVKY